MTRRMLTLGVLFAAALCSLVVAQVSSSTPQGPAPAPIVTQPSAGEKFPWPELVRPRSAVAAGTILGSLAIRVVQGTLGGPPIVSLPIEVELLHQGTTINTIETQLDEHGVVVLDNLPVSLGIQPVARIQYADLTYQVAGGMMDATHPQQQLDLVCYEPTLQQPDWKVQMRHVMMSEAKDGLHVTEVLVLESPADRTWIGDPGPKNKKVTTRFTLPKGAQKVTLGRGFHEWCCTTLADGALLNHLPLMPAVTEMVFSYVVPAHEGRASIDVTAPAPMDNMMVLVPDSLTIESFSGLTLSGTQALGESTMRYYLAANIPSGQRITISLGGLHSNEPVITSSDAETTSKIVAMIGGGVILVLALFIIIFKAGKGHKTVTSPA